uniref:SEC7 domain-containing protein n=1 Tax=Alexandrium catenella TaxID=2925 RepID=A0A7S1LWR9_ALECA
MIMLQTDLHNGQVKNKMTKDQFVSNNRGINDNNDLPREYLEKLYDSIATNPMSLKEDEDLQRRLDTQSAQGASQKFELFVRETESIVQKSQEMMKQGVSKHRSTAYVAAQSVEHVRPLFEVACWPYLATLAVLLEMQDSPTSVELCIEGFKHCIRIAARFDMDTERDAFVSSLAKFTYLITIKEMKQKNIECIKALFAIGLSEGNNLGPAWQFVLHCISQLERLHLIGSHSREDFQFFQGEEDQGSPSPAALTQRSTSVSTMGNQVLKRRAHGLGVSALVPLGLDDRQVELVNSESVIAQIDSAQIELLFNRSTSLGSTAIVHFVSQLARVSEEELALADQPRIFSLQKLVEVAHHNMGRIRLVWSQIWTVLSRHFVEVAKHSNIRVCMYGIDSLRQLAMKFLEKDELSNYNFQAEFLRPFEVVMTTPGVSKEVKDLVVSIISNMVHMRINNIKSGWKTVFHILHSAAQDHGSDATAQCAFACIEKVIEVSYHLFIENLTDGVRCLLAFGQCKANLSLSLKSIAYILQAAEYLADKTKPEPPPPPLSTLAVMHGSADAVAQAGPSHPAAHWFPILRGLSMLVSDPRRDVRAAALNGVFDVLREHGSAVFDEDTWRMVFNGVIKPLFYDIHDQLQNGDQRPDGAGDGRSEGTAASWAASMGPPTCLAALTALVRLFESNLASLSFLLDDVLRLIEKCIQHETEAVARIGVEGFKQLLLQTGRTLDTDSWQKVTASILKLFNDSMPTELMRVKANAPGDSQLPFRKEAVVNQCVVQLLLIDMLQDAVEQHYEHISTAGIMTLLDALQRSFEFAQEFNQQIELRQTLKRLGFMREMKQLPGLLKQEREALSCSLKVLFRVQSDERMLGSQHEVQAVERLMRLCGMVLSNYVSKEQHLQELTEARQEPVQAEGSAKDRDVEMEREISGLERIISEVLLRGLKDLQADQFARHAPALFPLLSELTVVNSREIRIMVRDVLLERVGPLLGQAPSRPAEAQAAGAAERPSPAGEPAAGGGEALSGAAG